MLSLIVKIAELLRLLDEKGIKMSYEAKIFNVMIASPGDVVSERNIVRNVVYEWNAIHSQTRNIVLLPVGWETHSSPEMGERPQEIINKQILDKCDLLVGVFWTRLGTETGKYPSGTVEEIEKHVKMGKPAMLYFSNQPVLPDSVDMRQYTKLKEFKTTSQKRGLYETYDNYAEFKEKFYRQLQLKINQDKYFAQKTSGQFQDTSISTTSSQTPILSHEASVILKEGSRDKHGTILFVRYKGGTDLQTNEKNLIEANSPKEVAKWEGALRELIDHDLVIERGSKGEVFELSNEGYKLADLIEL